MKHSLLPLKNYHINIKELQKQTLQILKTEKRYGYKIGERKIEYKKWNGVGLLNPPNMNDKSLWSEARSPAKSSGFWPHEFVHPNELFTGEIKNIIEQFTYPCLALLLCLESNSQVDKHREYSYDDMCKIHVPIFTNDLSKHFWINDDSSIEEYSLKEGIAYFFDTGKTHWVENKGDELRIHLVFTLLTSKIFKNHNMTANEENMMKLIEQGLL